MRHPYLIPSERELVPADLDLLRGKLVRLDLPFDAVGGFVEVRGTGAAARRISRDHKAVLGPAVDGKVSFPGTPPGSYRIELCADAACSTIAKAWNDVAVVAGRTVLLQ